MTRKYKFAHEKAVSMISRIDCFDSCHWCYSNCKRQEFLATENTEIHGEFVKTKSKTICISNYSRFVSFSVFFRVFRGKRKIIYSLRMTISLFHCEALHRRLANQSMKLLYFPNIHFSRASITHIVSESVRKSADKNIPASGQFGILSVL